MTSMKQKLEPAATRVRRSVAAPIRGRASRPNGARSATAEFILDAAHHVLVKHGYVGFTTRRVAEAAGITPGNLSYHFLSKRELLRAVITRLVAEYSERIEAFLLAPGIPVGQELESLVRWLLTDAIDEATQRTFKELWAMALHDVVVRRAVDNFYDVVMEGIVQLLMRSRPKADVVAIRELVQVLAIMSEGTGVLYGLRQQRVVPHERILQIVTPLLAVIAPDLQITAAASSPRSQPSVMRGPKPPTRSN